MTKAIVHGQTCEKKRHAEGGDGYMHMANDDTPYKVDGCWYCGRCHQFIQPQHDFRTKKERR